MISIVCRVFAISLAAVMRKSLRFGGGASVPSCRGTTFHLTSNPTVGVWRVTLRVRSKQKSDGLMTTRPELETKTSLLVPDPSGPVFDPETSKANMNVLSSSLTSVI